MGASPDSNDLWKQLAPELDEALSKLAARDRDALILRYFEGRDLKAVAAILGTSADAAQKRVARALEKLRIRLNARGIATTGAALAGMVNANGSRLPVNTSPVSPRSAGVESSESWTPIQLELNCGDPDNHARVCSPWLNSDWSGSCHFMRQCAAHDW